MASMNRPTSATYVVNEKVTIDTTDREDHTFSGIAFPIQCKAVLPINHIIIENIAIRGELGKISVWVTKQDSSSGTSVPTITSGTTSKAIRAKHYPLRPTKQRQSNKNELEGEFIMKVDDWDKIYEDDHKPSYRKYQELDLSSHPIVLKPGEVRGIYIHSTLDGDRAIVYDNNHHTKTYDDSCITVLPGRAHVSPIPFHDHPPWGWGGSAWRDGREFVGKISYGVVYNLWNPPKNLSFGDNFRQAAKVLLLCQRSWDCHPSLSDDCIFYILNMCRWDWFDDTYSVLRDRKKKNRKLLEAAATATHVFENDDEPGEVGKNDSGAQNNEVNSDVVDDEGIYRNYIEQARSFTFSYYDDCCSENEREAEAVKEKNQRRRTTFRHRFFIQINGLNADIDDDDSDYDSDYTE